MALLSSGILLWRSGREGREVLLAHFGGPYWRSRDEGAWSIPKGLIEAGESPLDAARREFSEETGLPAPPAEALQPLGQIRQGGGKLVSVFTAEGDLDPAAIQPMTFEMEWPPKSGRMQSYPEVDRVAWFDRNWASVMILPAMRPMLDRLDALLDGAD